MRVLPLYKPGDTVKGHLVLEVNKPVDAKQIKLLCSGVTYFYISAEEFKMNHLQEEIQLWCKSEETNHGDTDLGKDKVNGEEENGATEEEEEAKDNIQNKEEKETLITEEKKTASSEFIPVGKHRFQFSFKLPESCPSSVPNIASGSFTYVCINYRLKALIER